jgi:hypothetical protein
MLMNSKPWQLQIDTSALPHHTGISNSYILTPPPMLIILSSYTIAMPHDTSTIHVVKLYYLFPTDDVISDRSRVAMMHEIVEANR